MNTMRIKPWATVDPARLTTALHAKLGAAHHKLSQLREAEQPRLMPHLEPQTIVPDFLASAHGVFPTIRTFAEASTSKPAFNDWLQRWEAGLSPDELALWDHMRYERVAAEHSVRAAPTGVSFLAMVFLFIVRFPQGLNIIRQGIAGLRQAHTAARVGIKHSVLNNAA
jgi:hypothetical protein